jgi:plastocyanin domain-containing protein
MRCAQSLAAISILFLISGGIAQEQSKQKRVVATVGSDRVQKVEITAGSYYFDPNDIVVKVNVRVQLIVTKEGGTPHDISLQAPEAGIDFKESLSSKPKVIEFTPTKPGKYPFWCTKKPPFGTSHKDRGMQGLLEVVE